MRLTPTDLRILMSRPAMAKANPTLPPVPAQPTTSDCGGDVRISTGAGGNSLHLRLDGIPPSKKNSHMIIVNPKTKRPMVIPKKEYRDWESEKAASLFLQWEGAHLPFTRVHPCRIHILYAVKGMRSWDLSNKSESVLDALVKSGILEDDNRFVVKSLEMSSILASEDVVSITITPA